MAPRDNPVAAQPVTHDTGRGIPFFLWAYTNQQILYIQDKGGDENWRIYRVDIATAIAQDLTPFESVQARPLKVSRLHPDEIVIALNKRRPEWHDPYRLNLATGSLTLLEQNDQFFAYVVDVHFRLVLAASTTADGGNEIFKRTDEGRWEPWAQIPSEDALTTQPIGLDQAGSVLFMRDSRGRDTSAVLAVNLASQAATLLAADPRADAHDVVVHPTQQHVQAVSFIGERKRWQVLDPAIQPDLDYLASVADGEMEIVSRSLDDQTWVVLFLVDDGPIRFYLYDRRQRQARFLFSDRAELEGQPLVKMHSATIQARDGQDLVVYYSLPAGSDPDATAGRIAPYRWCSRPTAGRGGATSGDTTAGTNGWPTAATPCWRSTSVRPPASARLLPTPAIGSGVDWSWQTRLTPCAGPSRTKLPIPRK